MAVSQDLIRLEQLLRLVAKEDHHLQAVRDRFMPQGIEPDIGVDRRESFGKEKGLNILRMRREPR